MEPSKIKKILFFVLTISIGLVTSDDYSYDYAPESGGSSYDYPAYEEALSYEYEYSNSYDYAPSTDYNYDYSYDYGDNAEECQYLSANMEPYLKTCCRYPMLSITSELFMTCYMTQCSAIEGSDPLTCCIMTCCFETSGMIIYSKDDNGNAIEATGMNADSCVEAFLVDVDHDEAWIPVLRESASTCIDQNFKNDGQPKCVTLPDSLYTVIDCISNENYKKCPYWNPHDEPKCEYNRQYVEKCMEPGK